MKKVLSVLGTCMMILIIMFNSGLCGWMLHDIVDDDVKIVAQKISTGINNGQASGGASSPDDNSKKVANGISGNLPSEDDVFSRFTEENFESISMTEIETICEEIAILISYDLALEYSVEVDIVYDENISWTGCHYRNKNLIEINLYRLYKYCGAYQKDVHLYVVNVLAHEHRHSYQKQRLEQGYNTKLEQSYKNYISAEKDYKAYYNQLCEVDARNYGLYWENILKSWINA